MSALIIGNGNGLNRDLIKDLIKKADYIICADGGLEIAESSGVKPNIIVGDFDSVDSSVLKRYEDLNYKLLRYSPEKDYTDMELAVEHAVNKGHKMIYMIGATGSRLDHTLANVAMMENYFNKGINIEIVDNNNVVQIISGYMNIRIPFKSDSYMSIIPITEFIEGVTLVGFKYPLNNVTVKRGSTLCVSNQVVSKEGSVKIVKGTALLFISHD